MSQSSLSQDTASARGQSQLSRFGLVYQPVFGIKGNDRNVVAFEALLRIASNGIQQGPAEIISRAESDGSIVDIDRWVLSEVIKLLKPRPALKVWINASQLSIGHPTFVADALHTLIANQVLGRISFEVTETANVDARILAKRLEVLRLQALTVLVDDVRDGYAKRSLLLSDAVAGCKLSRESTRSLMTDEHARVDVQKLVKLCRRHGKQVVLEGIETNDELDLARQLNITLCQGFYLGMPASPSDLLQHPQMRPQA